MEVRSRFLVGIDLGTTNSALAYIDTKERAREGQAPPIRIFQIPQLVADGEVRALPALPSFLYFAAANELARQGAAGGMENANAVVGLFAREQGALVPGRQVSSAKSWLSLSSIDRTAKILPFNPEATEGECSPVEASSLYLAHLRKAWDQTFAAGEDAEEYRFENQEITLTVPASFDEEARELTVQAARDAGIKHLTLLEEPLAAFYAWISAHRRSLKRHLKDGQLVLVCDVGGGTTDFSLIRVRVSGKEVSFERTAIGEHLLLGGDNVDLALARRVEEKLGAQRLTLRQRNALQRQCCAAKEKLLNAPDAERVPVTLLGSGRSVVGGALTTELTRQEIVETLAEGFLPLTSPGDLPARERRTALRELGLPYAAEPAITKHLAAFLTYAGGSGDVSQVVRPDAVLFNGGFFAPTLTRERIIEAIGRWFSRETEAWRPVVLENSAPESAVAVGAAYYGLVRAGEGVRISGGSGRGYYVAVQAQYTLAENQVQAVCVMPRGTEEGTNLELSELDFTVLTNRPVSFTLYSSTTRADAKGDVVTFNETELHRHAPLITVLRYGKRSRSVELDVRLSVRFTEVGTLELWCESVKTEHRWRLQFQLRGAQPEATDDDQTEESPQNIISDDALDHAARLIRAVFGGPEHAIAGEPVAPETLTGKLEATLGYRKDAWPMTAIRKLCDVLAEVAEGRKKGKQFEARWLNLFGFCLRPGFGATLDDWRISQARKVYHEGLIFPRELQSQVEWLILWRRVAGGLNAGQQRELHQRQAASLGIGAKKRGGHINRQVEQEGWLLLTSLEHLGASARVALGEELIGKIEADPGNTWFQWALGRLGARIPFYGPLNYVVPARTAGEWIKFLLRQPQITSHIASAIVQLGARTNDLARDIDEELREAVVSKLVNAGVAGELVEALRVFVPPTRSDAARIFGESLPEGLRLVK